MILYRVEREEQVVVAACAAAQSAGVQAGMSVAHARALLDQPQVAVHDAAADRRALQRLAAWAQRFTPLTAVDPTPSRLADDAVPDGLLLDISGCEHLFGGERGLVAGLVRDLTRLGFGCRVAVAPTFGAAWAAAHFAPAPATFWTDDDLPAALAALPTAALRLPPAAQDALAEVGVETVAHLLALPRRTLLPRFGPHVLQRVDQALGVTAELLEPFRPRPLPAVQRAFDGPCQQLEAVQITIRELLEDLAGLLRKSQRGLTRLHLEVVRETDPPLQRTLTLSRPSASPRHLWALLAPHVERLDLGHGVLGVALRAGDSLHLPAEQLTCLEVDAGVPHRQQRAELLDMLSDRLGAARVCRLERLASHLPERAYRFCPAIRPGAGRSVPDPPEQPLYPALLLDPPERVEVLALQPDHPPTQVVWRGRTHVVVGGEGPQRIAPAWWTDSPRPGSTRDYYRVQDEHGCWLWVYHAVETGGWFVHGAWV